MFLYSAREIHVDMFSAWLVHVGTLFARKIKVYSKCHTVYLEMFAARAVHVYPTGTSIIHVGRSCVYCWDVKYTFYCACHK